MPDQADVRHWTDPHRATLRETHDEIDAIFDEIRAVAHNFPFRKKIAAGDKALSLELLVEINRIQRLVRAIERELSG